MQHFRRLAEGIAPAALLAKLEATPELWQEITVRQDYADSAHKHTETIFLRGPDAFDWQTVQGGFSAKNYPALAILADPIGPILDRLCFDLQVSELGRVMLVNLKSRCGISPHTDEGAYAEHFSRIHVALKSEVGNAFMCGGEMIHMKPGEAWWFDHQTEHKVDNDSIADRIHLIIDLVSPKVPSPRPGIAEMIASLEALPSFQKIVSGLQWPQENT